MKRRAAHVLRPYDIYQALRIAAQNVWLFKRLISSDSKEETELDGRSCVMNQEEITHLQIGAR